MKTLDKILWSILLPLLMSLGGCHHSAETTKESRFKNFEVQNMTFNSIENAQKKYQIDQAQRDLDNAQSDDEIARATSSLTLLRDGLNSVGDIDADGTNKEYPIALDSGEFYSITVHCKPAKAYNEKLIFGFTLISGEDNSYSKNIGIRQTNDINSSDEFDVVLDTQIPTDITSGKYVLVASIMNEDNETQESDLSKISKVGFVYLTINNNNSKQVTLTAVEGSKYIDLPYLPVFNNGYSNSDAQKSSLVVYNSSSKDENVTLSAVLKLASGEETPLGLLDTSDGVIKDTIGYTIFAPKEDDVEPITIDVSYYIPKDRYQTILDAIPDLSESIVDEAKGTIVWSIKSDDSTLSTNSIEAPMLLSKFVDDFDMVNNDGKRKHNKMLPNPAIQEKESSAKTQFIRYNKHTDDGPDGWQDISKIKNLTFSTIDAALDYSGEEAFLFSGDEFVTYDKNNQSVSEIQKINDRWQGIPFDHIDAALQADGYFFLFCGDRYIKTDHWNYMYPGYPKSIEGSRWDGLSKLTKIDSAVNYYDNRIYVFGEDNNGIPAYIRFNWYHQRADNGYPRKINGNWNQFKTNVSACFYDQYPNVICFKKGLLDKKIEKDGLFFKYDGKYNKMFGHKNKIGLAVDTQYASIGRWDVPGVSGSVEVNSKAYLYKKHFDIINIEAEAAVSLDAQYEKSGYHSSYNKSRTGSRLEVTVFGGKIFDKGRIDEITVNKKITKQNAQTLVNGKQSSNLIYMPLYTWDTHKDILSSTFFVGPVPVIVHMGVSGTIKIKLAVGREGMGIRLNSDVPSNLAIYIKGGFNGAIVEAGMGGDVRIIEVAEKALVRTGLTLTPEENLAFNLDFDSNINLRILAGYMYLYAEKRIKYPSLCGLKFCWKRERKEYRRYLYHTPWLYKRTWDLLEKEFNLYTIELK